MLVVNYPVDRTVLHPMYSMPCSVTIVTDMWEDVSEVLNPVMRLVYGAVTHYKGEYYE